MTDPTRTTEVFPVQEKNVPLLLRDLLAIEYPLVLKRVELVRANLKALHNYVGWMESVAAAAGVPLPLPDVDPELAGAAARAPAEPFTFGNGSAINLPVGEDLTFVAQMQHAPCTAPEHAMCRCDVGGEAVDLETYPVQGDEPRSEEVATLLASVVRDMIPKAFRVKPVPPATEDAPEATA